MHMTRQHNNTNQGQSTTEYAVVVIVIIVALLAMQNYMKRGMQGRMKSTVDDVGEQYDPGVVNLSAQYSLLSNSDSSISIGSRDSVDGQSGFYTQRRDATRSIEVKQGTTAVAPP